MTVFVWDTDINDLEWEPPKDDPNNKDDPSLEIREDKSKAKIKAAEREVKEEAAKKLKSDLE